MASAGDRESQQSAVRDRDERGFSSLPGLEESNNKRWTIRRDLDSQIEGLGVPVRGRSTANFRRDVTAVAASRGDILS